MPFIHVQDIAAANLLAAKAYVADEVFSIASGAHISLNDTVYAFLIGKDSALRPEYRPEPEANPVPRRLADTHNTEGMFGFRAQASLDAGLLRVLNWWREKSPPF